MRLSLLPGVVVIHALATASANAQPPSPEGGRSLLFRYLPILAALDTDGDGVISAAEMEQSVKALKSLDKNGDGKLTEDELRPNEQGRGGFQRRGPEGEGGRGPGGGADDTIEQLMQFDANKDGKLTKEELPARMQAIITRADANQDGAVTREELARMSQAEGGGRREGERREGERREGERRGFEGRGPGGFGPGGPGGRGGFGNPAAMIDRWFEFDADKDGKLSREELNKMFEQMAGPAAKPEQGGPGGREERRPRQD